jgi:hypothetical protein
MTIATLRSSGSTGAAGRLLSGPGLAAPRSVMGRAGRLLSGPGFAAPRSVMGRAGRAETARPPRCSLRAFGPSERRDFLLRRFLRVATRRTDQSTILLRSCPAGCYPRRRSALLPMFPVCTDFFPLTTSQDPSVARSPSVPISRATMHRMVAWHRKPRRCNRRS